MSSVTRTRSSEYMHWAKTLQAAPYNLGNSGVNALRLRELSVSLDDLELSGASFYGWPPLQAALAKHLRVPVDCVVHAEGTSQANHLAMAALLDPGDEVLIESPTYKLIVSTAEYLGAKVRRFDRLAEHRFGVDLGILEKSLTPRTRLIVLTNLHNPSSAYLDETTLRGISELARSVGARVLVDEVYLDAVPLAHAESDLPPLSSAFHLADNIVVTSSLTKVYGLSGIRCGWVLAQPELATQIWRLNDLFNVIPAHAAERLSVLVFEQFARVSARARALLDDNRELLNAFFASRDDLESWPLEAGTVSFPRLRQGRVEHLCEVLRERHETTVVPGRFFDHPEHFRVGIGAPVEITREGLRRLGLALDEIRSQAS